MRLCVRAFVAIVSLALLAPAALEAGVKTEQRVQFQMGGFLGGIMNRFGGKAAKEGAVNTVAVVGDRKLTLGDTTGEIVDLAEEKVYRLDPKKKSYEVVTFAEMKAEFEKQKAEAAKRQAEMEKEQAKQEQEAKPEDPQKVEVEVDFEMKETGQKKQVAGHDAREVQMIVTVREKGRTLQQSGGLVMTNAMWLAPKIDAMKEIEDFDRRHALKMMELMGVGLTGSAAAMPMDQMAAMFAMYPGLTKAMERMKAEADKVNLEGTAVANTLTIDAVKSAAQMAQQEEQQADTGGGLGGMLARRMMKKKEPAGPRAMLLTTNMELLKIAPDATAADVAVPAGYKQK